MTMLINHEGKGTTVEKLSIGSEIFIPTRTTNSKINELIKEAGFSDDFIDDYELGSAQQRFAKLIVRECLHTMETTSSGDMDFAIWKIKKDFGIKQ